MNTHFPMAFIDRTPEFMGLTQGQRGPPPDPVKKQHFNTLASQIGHDLWAVSQRLAEVVRLAQSPIVLFGGEQGRAQELMHVVKVDLERLHLALQRLTLSGPETNHAKEHMARVRGELEGRLLATGRQFAQAHKAQAAALFAQEKRRARLGASSASPLPPAEQGGGDELSIAVAIPGRSSMEVERAAAVRDLEANVAEVASLFRQLTATVAAQTEQIARIEDNVLTAEAHASEADRQLGIYLAAVSDNRGLVLKLFGVLLVFIVLFVLFGI